jgi:hypothetical protein
VFLCCLCLVLGTQVRDGVVTGKGSPFFPFSYISLNSGRKSTQVRPVPQYAGRSQPLALAKHAAPANQYEAGSGWIKSSLPLFGGGNLRFGFGGFTFFLGGFFGIRAYLHCGGF